MSNSIKVAIVVLAALCIANIIFGIGMYQSQNQRIASFARAVQMQMDDSQLTWLPGRSSQSLLNPDTMPSTNSAELVFAQLNNLTQRVAKLETQLAQLPSTAPSNSSSTSAPTPTSSKSPKIKESIFFLGSGSTPNRDWTLIPSAQIQLDTGYFTRIKEVRFEAGLSIIGGEAHARLIDLTSNEPFYTSEVFNNTSTATWQISSPLILQGGSRSYSVQLKSTSGEEAILEGARIRVVVE